MKLSDFKKWMKLRKQEMEIRSLAVGMNSTVDITQDLHIIMLDYDVEQIEKVCESVKELQSFWNLSSAEIFKTKHGFHVFFWWDIVPYERLKMIINYAKYVDPMYKYISRFYDHKTIRVAGKHKEKDIEFLMSLEGAREPNENERDIGDMKKSEHSSWLFT